MNVENGKYVEVTEYDVALITVEALNGLSNDDLAVRVANVVRTRLEPDMSRIN